MGISDPDPDISGQVISDPDPNRQKVSYPRGSGSATLDLCVFHGLKAGLGKENP